MKLRDIIAEHGTDPDAATAARNVIAVIMRHPRLAGDLLFGPVHDEIRRQRRREARKAEDLAFSRDLPHILDPELSWQAERLAALSQLRDVPFSDVLSGAMVTWGTATAAQHQARAERISHALERSQLTVDRHLYAAKTITEAGVLRLQDVPGYGAP